MLQNTCRQGFDLRDGRFPHFNLSGLLVTAGDPDVALLADESGRATRMLWANQWRSSERVDSLSRMLGISGNKSGAVG